MSEKNFTNMLNRDFPTLILCIVWIWGTNLKVEDRAAAVRLGRTLSKNTTGLGINDSMKKDK